MRDDVQTVDGLPLDSDSVVSHTPQQIETICSVLPALLSFGLNDDVDRFCSEKLDMHVPTETVMSVGFCRCACVFCLIIADVQQRSGRRFCLCADIKYGCLDHLAGVHRVAFADYCHAPPRMSRLCRYLSSVNFSHLSMLMLSCGRRLGNRG